MVYFLFIKHVNGEKLKKNIEIIKTLFWKKYLTIIFCLLLQLKMKDLIITTAV